MPMTKVEVTLKSTKPLLFNQFRDASEQETSRGKKVQLSKQEEANQRLYKDDEGNVYIPWTWLAGSLRTVASAFKSQLNKKLKSLKGIVGGSVSFPNDRIYFNEKYNENQVEIYSTSAVVPATRGRIMVHRPMLREWSVSFPVEIDTDLLTVDEVKNMFQDAGQRAGIGDYRISKGGPFGTFVVEEFAKVK